MSITSLDIPFCKDGSGSVSFTILINTNNTSNYQPTNETHYTQQNNTTATYKRSQPLKLIETRYQVQPSDKELHTEHTSLRTKILHVTLTPPSLQKEMTNMVINTLIASS